MKERRPNVNPPAPDALEPDTLLLVPLADHDQLDLSNRGVMIEVEHEHAHEILSKRLADGRLACLAFTSEDELREWSPDGGPYIRLEAVEVARMAFESGHDVVFVNPYSRDYKAFVINRDGTVLARRPPPLG
jgi:hypothetical protein